MQIMVRSRKWVEKYFKPTAPVVIISVNTPGDELASIHNSPFIKDILFLSFHDIGPEYTKFDNPEEWVPFNRDMAAEILEFVSGYAMFNDVVLLIHCDAGISRSAGIAAAISLIDTGDDAYWFDKYLPNLFVYRQILNVHYGRTSGTD